MARATRGDHRATWRRPVGWPSWVGLGAIALGFAGWASGSQAADQPPPCPAQVSTANMGDTQALAFLEGTAADLYRNGRSEQAVDLAREAICLREAAPHPEPGGLASAWLAYGEILRDLQRWAGSGLALRRGLALREAHFGRRSAEAALARHALGAWQESQGLLAEAAKTYGEAEAILRQTRPGSLGQARVLRDLAGVQAQRQRHGDASTLLAQADGIARGLPEDTPGRQALLFRVWVDQASLAAGAGQNAQATERVEAALSLEPTALQPPLDRASGLHLRARLRGQSGHWAGALADAAEVRRLVEAARGPKHLDTANVHSLMAQLKYKTGDLAGAAAEARSTLALRQTLLPTDHPDTTTALNDLALILLEGGQTAEALPLLAQAIARWETQPEALQRQAAGLHNLAAGLMRAGQVQDARNAFERAIAAQLRAGAEGSRELAQSRSQLAEALDAVGEHTRAAALHQEALVALLSDPAAPLEQALAMARLADHHARRGDLAAAIFQGKQAVSRLQALRSNLASADLQRAQRFVGSREPIYQRLSARLIDAGRIAEAQEVQTMLKLDELREYQRGELGNQPPAQASMNGLESQAARDWNQLADALRKVAVEAAEIDRVASTGAPLGPAQAERRRALRSERAAALRQLESFVTQTQRRLRESAEGQSAESLQQLEYLQTSLKDSGDKVALIHYVMLAEELRIIVTWQGGLVPHVVPVPAAELNRAIARFREQIRLRDPAVRETAQQLHAWLVRPIEGDLAAAGAETLLLSVVGSLRYLPFAALHDGQAWLVERYATAIYTPAASASIFRQPAGDWRAAGFGLVRAVPGFSPLPAVRTELSAVIGPGGLPGRFWLDDEFTRDSVDDALLGRATVVHLATHVVFKPGTETESFMLLGDGSRLTLGEMQGFDLSGVQLLTLSACETAVGGGLNENGREIEGFAAAAQRRGAAAVMASLWPVADDSTARLMQSFYQGRQATVLPTKVQALRAAQREMIHGGQVSSSRSGSERGARVVGAGGSADPTSARAHPYHWAAFVLIGNWR